MSEPKEINTSVKSWWCGDKRVEPFMSEVNKLLHNETVSKNIKPDIKIAIYNRCYEAVYEAIKKYDNQIIVEEKNDKINNFEIQFRFDVPCYMCEENDKDLLTVPTIYIDAKTKEGKTIGGYCCKKHFDEAIKEYIKNLDTQEKYELIKKI